MSATVKKIANQFVKKHQLKKVNYSALRDAVKAIGFCVVEFNSIFNDEDVETIIQNLHLDEDIKQSRGFTYADKNYRLIFINEDLNEEEKLYVISHELGHIICEHYTTSPIIGRDVKEEYEANEFSHYLLKNNLLRNLKISVSKHKRMAIALTTVLFVALCLVASGFVINKEKSYYGDFYITTTGDKYHQVECIHIKNKNNIERLTKDQFESGEYKPCGTCLPQG